MKFRCLKKMSYIGLSVGIAALIIFTALPYYLLTSIAFPGWNIYWSYADVQTIMMWLFLGMAFIGALSTLKKKNTVEDVFLNVAAPMTVLLALRCFQYHTFLVLAFIIFTVTEVTMKLVDVYTEDNYRNFSFMKRIRIAYYLVRKRGVLLLFVLLTPLTVWTACNEYYNSEKYLTYFESASEVKKYEDGEKPVWAVVPEEKWDSLAVNTRFEEFQKMITYFLQDQGCEDVRVYACKELTDGTLAYYSDYDESISVNIIYLDTCTYKEAIHVAAHECQHRQQHEIIHAVELLEESGISCENNEYFKDAYALKQASDKYGYDALSYTTYNTNLMEVRSEEYAAEMEKRLREDGYLK